VILAVAICGLLVAVGRAAGVGGPAPPGGACVVVADCGEPCFGAAARDPAHQPCENPKLALAVVPPPSVAEIDTGGGCPNARHASGSLFCSFGPDPALQTFALLGDSHADEWRPALGGMAYAFRWRGVAITRAGCPFSLGTVPNISVRLRSECLARNRAIVRWFESHPNVHVVFVSAHAGARILGPGGRLRFGADAFGAKAAGYAAGWRTLPRTVRHIVVIRDNPVIENDTLACVRRAIAGHRPAGPACAVRRTHALKPDPAVAAANLVGSPRVQVVDLSRMFCGDAACYPVIGGVLVYKDTDHMTSQFSTTLGPFLLRQVERLTALPSWGSLTTFG
jgi:hypothetical protein